MSGEQQRPEPPDTRVVAAALDVDPERLRHFAEYHPNPRPADVLGLAERPPADGDTRGAIERWLAAQTANDDAPDERAGGRVPPEGGFGDWTAPDHGDSE